MKSVSCRTLPGGWSVVTAKNLADVESLRPVWEKLQNSNQAAAPNADIDRFISVIETMKDIAQPHVILLQHNGTGETLVIGRLEKTRLNCKIGYKTLLKPALRCLSIVYGGVLGRLTDDTFNILLGELQATFAKNEADVVFFNHLRTDSPVHKLITTKPGFFCRGHLTRTEVHRTMPVPENIERFYEARSKKHRGNLRRYIKKIQQEYADRARIAAYQSEDQAEEFIKAASQISGKTYQEKLGSGIKDDEQMVHYTRTAAKYGWLRAHVLYLGDEPCAFQYGLQYKKTYFLEQIGFDPKWSQHNVGTVLFLKVLEELCAAQQVQTLDFGFGDAEYKRSYCDKCWTEASAYIFAPRLYPILVNMAQSSMMGLSLGLEYVLNKTDLSGRIKRSWRNLLRAKSPDEASYGGKF